MPLSRYLCANKKKIRCPCELINAVMMIMNMNGCDQYEQIKNKAPSCNSKYMVITGSRRLFSTNSKGSKTLC